MELSLDIFRNDAFSYAALQRVVPNVPYIPSRLGRMQLFNPKLLTGTDKVIIYEEDGNIRLIPMTERGAPDIQQQRNQGRMYALQTKRVAKMDTLRASELLGVANMALPETVRMRNAMKLLRDRTQDLKNDKEMTLEHHRLAAIQGKLLDADGTTVVYDYFTEFGVSPPATITMNFGTIAVDDFQMYLQETFLQPMQLALKDRWVDGVTYISALVGDTFWGKLIRHPAVREVWKLQQQGAALAAGANPLLRPNLWEEITVGGITFMHYRGSTAGEIAVPANTALFFPVGAKDVFDVYWAPGETLEQVQAEAQPEYLMIQPDVRSNMVSHVDVFLRCYPLYACIFPKGLLKAVHA